MKLEDLKKPLINSPISCQAPRRWHFGYQRQGQGLYRDGILKKPEGWKYAPDLLQYYDAKTSIEQELYLIMLEYRQRTFQGAFHASNDYMHGMAGRH